MKVLLIDGDGDTFPNLALMKLSTYHKNLGDEVFKGSCKNPDLIYASCVFSWNKMKTLQATSFYPDTKVIYGGTGYDLETCLPKEVEESRPDYSLYPIDYSIGFTTRGCIRNCPWCLVPEKEGDIKKGTPLTEFVNPKFNKIILLDNNLLSYSGHVNILKELISLNKKTSFSQGLDIRLINNENASLLSEIKYYDIMFKNRRLHFAWDEPKIEKELLKGINILLDTGIRPRHLMFYVLVNFNTTYEEDIHRVQTLLDLGTIPYVMLYNGIKGTYQHHLKRWVERRYCYVVPWEEYDHGNSQKIIQSQRAALLSSGIKKLDSGAYPL